MKFEYIERAGWDTSGLPRLGVPVPRVKRTELIVHHTVAADNDPTPIMWETLDEIKKFMLRLQQSRPDLGLDVPYNFVAFCRPGDTLTICEGRGFDRDGSHTKFHNVTGLATSFAANFEAFGIPNIIPALNEWFTYMRGACQNLNGFYGHRDFTGPTSPHPSVGWTACPGTHMYATKPQWKFLEDDMPLNDADLAKIRAIVKDEINTYVGDPAVETQGRNVLKFVNESDDYIITELKAYIDEKLK